MVGEEPRSTRSVRSGWRGFVGVLVKEPYLLEPGGAKPRPIIALLRVLVLLVLLLTPLERDDIDMWFKDRLLTFTCSVFDSGGGIGEYNRYEFLLFCGIGDSVERVATGGLMWVLWTGVYEREVMGVWEMEIVGGVGEV